jgi:hypothetical protein
MGSVFSCEASDKQLPESLASKLKQPASELLAHDPEYALDKLAIVLGGQVAELSYSMRAKGLTVDDLTAGAAPEQLAKKAVLRAALKIHRALIDRALSEAAKLSQQAATDPASALLSAAAAGASLGVAHLMMERFIQLGYLEREGDYIKVAATLEDAQVLINGKALALPALPTGP